MPSCRDQGRAAGSARGAGGPRGLRPGCPPLPASDELVDAGASPADQRRAIIASAKDPALTLPAETSGVAKADAQHGALGPMRLRGWVHLANPVVCVPPQNAWVSSSCLASGHVFPPVPMGVGEEAALWR